jgi:hypothetical protein
VYEIHIPRLYELAKREKKPMTKVLNEIVADKLKEKFSEEPKVVKQERK